MKPITNEDIKVLGRIVNISTENVVADASQVWDSEQKKDQETINNELVNKTDLAKTDKYGIVRLAVNASDPDNTDVVTVKTLRDAISEAVDALLAGEMTLDTFRELAEALNNDPNFYTWVTNQLALKADKSALDALTGRVSTLESDVAYLKACCAEVQEYMQHFSITWHQAKGGSHVRISPTTIKFGSNTVLFTIDDGYYLGEPISTSNVKGSYATVSCTESNGTYTLILTGVEGNVVIEAPIKKEFTVTFMGDGHVTSSNTSTKTVKGAYTTNIIAATNYYLDTSTVRPRYATSAQEYTDQMFSFSFGASGADYSSDSSSTVAVRASISLSGVNGDIIIPAGTKPLKRTVEVNLTGDGGATFSGATGQMNRGTSYSGTITVPSNSTLDSVVVLQYVMSSPGSGYWTNMTSTYYNSSTRTISTTNLHDDITINIRSSALGTGPTPTEFGTVTVSPDHGTASPASFSADGTSHTITITPASGYTTTGMTATTTNSDLTVSVSGNTITVTGTSSNNATINVIVPAESTPEDQNVNRGNMYVTFVNAKSPDRSVRPVSTTASSFTMNVEPPYDTMTTTSERDLWEYDMTISVKDIDGNEYVTYDTTDTSDFYKITGLHTASYNQPAILSGSGVSGTIRPSTSRNTIGFESISSNKDLYITITYQDSFSNTGDTTFYTHLGKNQRNGASYNREWFSFNALGKYTNPLIPYDIKSFDDSEESSYTCVYGDPTYGEASRSINIGNISSISGLTGSTDSEKLTDLQTKISYLFVKKAGISNGSDVYYDDYRHLETSENGCPFAVSNVSLDSNSNVILTITCAAADPTAGVSTETFESVTFRTSDASDVVTWNMTTTDQHLKGSYHVSQLLVLCGDSVIYSERLCREIYGFINCYPNTSRGPVTTNGVWQGVGYYFLQPMNAFTAKSGYNTLPDLSIAINNHGTSTDAGINLTYNDDGTITDPTMIGGSYVDISMTASPVNNTYPSLTSTYDNFRRVDGIELVINGVPPTFS